MRGNFRLMERLFAQMRRITTLNRVEAVTALGSRIRLRAARSQPNLTRARLVTVWSGQSRSIGLAVFAIVARKISKPGLLLSISSPLRSSCPTARISVVLLTKCAVAGRRSIRLCCPGTRRLARTASISPVITPGLIASISTPTASCRCSSNGHRVGVDGSQRHRNVPR